LVQEAEYVYEGKDAEVLDDKIKAFLCEKITAGLQINKDKKINFECEVEI